MATTYVAMAMAMGHGDDATPGAVQPTHARTGKRVKKKRKEKEKRQVGYRYRWESWADRPHRPVEKTAFRRDAGSWKARGERRRMYCTVPRVVRAEAITTFAGGVLYIWEGRTGRRVSGTVASSGCTYIDRGSMRRERESTKRNRSCCPAPKNSYAAEEKATNHPVCVRAE